MVLKFLIGWCTFIMTLWSTDSLHNVGSPSLFTRSTPIFLQIAMDLEFSLFWRMASDPTEAIRTECFYPTPFLLSIHQSVTKTQDWNSPGLPKTQTEARPSAETISSLSCPVIPTPCPSLESDPSAIPMVPNPLAGSAWEPDWDCAVQVSIYGQGSKHR